MVRRLLVVGNWKMNGCLSELQQIDIISSTVDNLDTIDVGLAVPATLILSSVARVNRVVIGAQDIHPSKNGSFTGSVSADMVYDVGARFSLVGHSERRLCQHETNAHVRAKIRAARAAGLNVILCVGETSDERCAGKADEVVRRQISESVPDDADGSWFSIAYEPVWAIGTRRLPSSNEINHIHSVARHTLVESIGRPASLIRIIYGGSVNNTNAQMILALSEVDGLLVGKASLDGSVFLDIVKVATLGLPAPSIC